ncbi:MAG: PaaI family thioesterase [Pseudomonadota bacterium]
MTDAVSKITADDFYALMHAEMPLVIKWGISIDALGDGTATVRLPYQGDLIRPGGTIMGPAMMMLGDLGVYVAVLTKIGKVELAVTTSLTTNFLRKPAPGDLIGDARIIKLGRRLAYGEVFVHSEHEEDPVAHITATYSIPPDRA